MGYKAPAHNRPSVVALPAEYRAFGAPHDRSMAAWGKHP